jgi:hypothetical protein
MRFHLTDQRHVRGMRMAIHTLHENIVVTGRAQTVSPIVATNVYIQTERGWRMLLHHASPVLREPDQPEEPGPTVLH